MKVFNEIPFDFDFDKFSKKINIEKYNSEMKNKIDSILEETLPLVKPKALYKVAYVEEKEKNNVIIDDVKFFSEVLRENLDDINRVFPFVATCGNELEQIQEDTNDFLVEYWIDILKEMSLAAASKYLHNHIKEKYKIEQISSMNPGSGDVDLWPIEQQEQLFSLLGDVKDSIGVQLTDSHLMVPNKSVSGIYFPTDIKFINCQYCTRKDCPSRKAPFKKNSVQE